MTGEVKKIILLSTFLRVGCAKCPSYAELKYRACLGTLVTVGKQESRCSVGGWILSCTPRSKGMCLEKV